MRVLSIGDMIRVRKRIEIIAPSNISAESVIETELLTIQTEAERVYWQLEINR